MITKIKSISVKELDRDGNEYVDKYGHKQARVAIQISEPQFENVWLSHFEKIGGQATQWERGMEVDISVEEKNGYWNFKSNKPASKAMADSFRAKGAQSNGGLSPITNNGGKGHPGTGPDGVEVVETYTDLSLPHDQKEIHDKLDEILVGVKEILNNMKPPF